jgi:hypothetical protein
MKTRLLHYHPYNSEGSIDLNTCLTSTLLKFNLDWLTEYQDVDDGNKLIYRE